MEENDIMKTFRYSQEFDILNTKATNLRPKLRRGTEYSQERPTLSQTFVMQAASTIKVQGKQRPSLSRRETGFESVSTWAPSILSRGGSRQFSEYDSIGEGSSRATSIPSRCSSRQFSKQISLGGASSRGLRHQTSEAFDIGVADMSRLPQPPRGSSLSTTSDSPALNLRPFDEDHNTLVESPIEMESVRHDFETKESLRIEWRALDYARYSSSRHQSGYFQLSPRQSVASLLESATHELSRPSPGPFLAPEDGVRLSQKSTEEASSVSSHSFGTAYNHFMIRKTLRLHDQQKVQRARKARPFQRFMKSIESLDAKYFHGRKERKHAKQERKKKTTKSKANVEETNSQMREQIKAHRDKNSRRINSWEAEKKQRKKDEETEAQRLKAALKQNKRIDRDGKEKTFGALMSRISKIRAAIASSRNSKASEPIQVQRARGQSPIPIQRVRVETEILGYRVG